MAKDEVRDKHPAFGMVGFSRRQGNPGRLFGSSLKMHESYVTLSIRTAERIRESGYDRFYGSIRGDLIEVDLSAAQFAELLTTMNVGIGVPCTIRHVDGKRVDLIPDDDALEVEQIRKTFRKEVRQHAADMRKEMVGLQDLLDKKNLGQADRRAIMSKFESMLRKYEDSAPFMLDQFEEASEKVVQHAKAEVDAFITSNVMAEGIRAITQRVEERAKQLPPAEGEVSHVEGCDCSECK